MLEESSKCNTNSLLSVVIPVGASFGKLDNLITTLKATSTFPIKVFLVCDLNGDGTYQQLQSTVTGLQNPKITLLSGQFGNPGAARNFGLGLVKTEWVAFWDADDIAYPDQLVLLISEATKEINIISGSFRIYELQSEETRQNFLPSTYARALLSIGFNPGIWRFAFRTSFIKNHKFSNLRMGEDQNFLSSIDITSSNLLISKSIIYKYCVGHVGQLTKDQIAIADVIEAAKITMHQIKLSKNGLNLLPYFFLIRQFYTGLKYGTSNVRRENLLSLIKFSMSINFRKRIALLIAILLVTLNLCLSAPTNILGKLRNRIAS